MRYFESTITKINNVALTKEAGLKDIFYRGVKKIQNFFGNITRPKQISTLLNKMRGYENTIKEMDSFNKSLSSGLIGAGIGAAGLGVGGYMLGKNKNNSMSKINN